MLRWDEDPQRTERGIQMLLRHQYPGLRSFDGAGGDGGRDARLVTADGRIVFEIKSFGRLNSSRRRQIKASLAAALESEPAMTRWVLVIPMNMTASRPDGRSSEEVWFNDDLKRLAPHIELDWWGLDWLDYEISQDMAVQRYIEGPDGQLLQRAGEHHLEQAVLARGADDLHARLSNLQMRAAEVSPFWTLDFGVTAGIPFTTLRAKVEDAQLLDPITITPTFAFRIGDPDEELLRRQFERTLDFGGTVHLPPGHVTRFEIDASEEARLLFSNEDPRSQTFSIISERQRLSRPMRCRYQVLDPEGRVKSEFDVYLREYTSGARGITLFGGDAAEVVALTVVVPRPEDCPVGAEATQAQPVVDERIEAGAGAGGADIDLTLPDDAVAYEVDALLPVLRTLGEAASGHRICLQLPGLGNITSAPLDSAAFAMVVPVLQVVEDLHRMQGVTGDRYNYPTGLTVGQVKDLRSVVRRLDGEYVEHEGGLSLNLIPDAVGDFLSVMERAPQMGSEGGFWAASEVEELVLGDLTLRHGPTAFWAGHPRLANLEDLRSFAAAHSSNANDAGSVESVEARFEPTDVPFRWVPHSEAVAYFESQSGQGDAVSQ